MAVRDLSGQQIRGYQVEELIGSGGFAAVYRAYQPAVEREVAIKIILPRYANNPDFVRRFEAEAQLIARLEHIHIVPLYDYWREPDNAYLVMRWLRGGTLYDSLVTDGAWPLQDIARLLDQVAAALAVAHRSGVIHQDLTPANILLDEERNAFLADFGIAKDLRDLTRSQQDEEQPLFGSPAYMAPEQITGAYISPQSDIYSLGIVLFQLLTGQLPFDAPDHTTLIRQQVQAPLPPLQSVRSDLAPELNVIVMRAAAKNPGVRYPDALSMAAEFKQVVQSLSPEMAQPASAVRMATSPIDESEAYGTLDLGMMLAEPKNPYMGLRAFDEADTGYFFGRNALISQVCRRLAELPPDSRLLTVVGPSGSGKSSLVRAGVIPALRRGDVPGSEKWFIARMLPGAFPLAELEMALLGVTFDVPDTLTTLLNDPRQGLAAAVKTILPDDDSELVLVIDQFEEVFTLVDFEDERRAFLNMLQRAATTPGSRLRIVIALRADFYDRPLMYPEFGSLVRANTEVVLPLSAANLRAAIVEPARKEMLDIEEAVVDAIVAEVSDEPGALPLLQYALTELFERRNGRILTLAAYRESGGVSGALARRAETLYSGMLYAHQVALRQIFLRLVTLGDSTADTRRRILLSDLLGIRSIQRSVLDAVLDELGRYRLLTFDHDPQTREPTVEVAHEALITHWDRLRTWLDQNRDRLRVQRQLAAAAAEWRAAGQDSSFLARGARLVQFESLMDSDQIALTAHEQEYLQQSMRLRQRAVWRRRGVIAVLVIITLAALIAAGVALDREQEAERAQATTAAERDRADQQARIARSRQLAVTALSNDDQPALALLLGLEALRAADTYEARNSLLTLLQAYPQINTLLHVHAAPVRCVAFSPDGRWFVTGDRAGKIVLWDAATRELIAQVALPEPEAINAVAIAADGMVLAAGSDDGGVYLWQHDALDQGPVALTGHEAAVWSVAFDPNTGMLASGSADGTIRLWDVAAGEPVGEPLLGHEDFVFSVAFNAAGTLLASGGADNTVRFWDVENGEPVGEPLEGHTNWVWSVAFSPGGRVLASGSADNTIRLWDVASGEPKGDPLTGHTDWVRSVAYGPEGQLVSAGADGTVRLWDTFTREHTRLVAHRDAVWGVAFDPGGTMFVSAGADTSVIAWDAVANGLRLRTLIGHLEAISSVAVSPDGTLIASAGGEPLGRGRDNTIRLWDAATGEQLAVLEGHDSVVSAIAFGAGGDVLASASADSTIRLWDVARREPVMPPLTEHRALLLALAIAPDGQVMASGGGDGSLVLWDVASGDVLAGPLFGHTGGILDLAFSPDGATLASGGEDGLIQLWDVSAAEPSGVTIHAHDDVVTRLAFSPDGTLLASGSRDETIRLWDWRSNTMVGQPLIGHARRITALAFHPSGDLLASGSQDATIRLWDVAAGRTIGQPFAAHEDWVADLAFSPAGVLVSGSWDTQIMVWAASLETWQANACRIANRDLTPGEWARYMPDIPYRTTCGQGT